jgi:hypothetical protein
MRITALITHSSAGADHSGKAAFVMVIETLFLVWDDWTFAFHASRNFPSTFIVMSGWIFLPNKQLRSSLLMRRRTGLPSLEGRPTAFAPIAIPLDTGFG